MLTQGVVPAWKTLYETFETILNEENKWLNPIMVFQSLLTMQALPPLIKEMFTEYEWFTSNMNIISDMQSFGYMYNLYGSYDGYQELEQELEAIKKMLFADQLETKQQFEDFARSLGYDQRIVKYLDLTDLEIQNAQLDILADSV